MRFSADASSRVAFYCGYVPSLFFVEDRRDPCDTEDPVEHLVSSEREPVTFNPVAV